MPQDGWNKVHIVATVVLSLAGVLVAFLIGKGQIDISSVQERTARIQALASLIVALGDEKPAVRRLTAISLARFEEAVDPLLNILGDEDPTVSEAAIRTLILLHKKTPITDRLLKELKEFEGKETIRAFVKLLLKIEKEGWRKELFKTLDEHTTITTTDVVVNVLKAEIDVKDFKEFMQNFLAARRLELRRVAAETLGEVGREEVIDPLRQTLRDEDRSVWRAGVDALTRVSRRVGAPDRQKVVGWFLEDLRNAGQSLENRLYLIDALKGMGGKEIRLALKDFLGDEKEDVRVQIARVLAEEWDEEAVEWLIPALEDREWRVRIAVIGALGSLCEKKPEGVASTIEPKVKDRLSRMMSDDQDNIVREKTQAVHTKVQERAC